MGNTSANAKEFVGNVGTGLAMIMGVQGTFIHWFLWLMGLVIDIGAAGLRLLVRKKQGKAVLGFAWLYLWAYLALIGFIVIVYATVTVKKGTPPKYSWSYITDNKYIVFYIIALIVGVVFHVFKDFQPERKGMEADPFYTGTGILGFLAKGNYRKTLYTNLIDPILVLPIGYWFYLQKESVVLGVIILFSAVCLLIESIVYLAVDWHIRQTIIIAPIRGQEYSGSFTNENTSNEDVKANQPRIFKNK